MKETQPNTASEQYAVKPFGYMAIEQAQTHNEPFTTVWALRQIYHIEETTSLSLENDIKDMLEEYLGEVYSANKSFFDDAFSFRHKFSIIRASKVLGDIATNDNQDERAALQEEYKYLEDLINGSGAKSAKPVVDTVYYNSSNDH